MLGKLCVHAFPLRYHWQGFKQTFESVLLSAKFRSFLGDRFLALLVSFQLIVERLPLECPSFMLTAFRLRLFVFRTQFLDQRGAFPTCPKLHCFVRQFRLDIRKTATVARRDKAFVRKSFELTHQLAATAELVVIDAIQSIEAISLHAL